MLREKGSRIREVLMIGEERSPGCSGSAIPLNARRLGQFKLLLEPLGGENRMHSGPGLLDNRQTRSVENRTAKSLPTDFHGGEWLGVYVAPTDRRSAQGVARRPGDVYAEPLT